MNLFPDPKDEERVCKVLKAYVEEYGPESVIVSVPKTWKDNGYNLGRTRLEFTTTNTISVRVEYETVRLQYEITINLPPG